MLIWNLIFFGVYVVGYLSLWRRKRHLQRLTGELVRAAKELERQQKQFRHQQTMFVLGIHTARESRQSRIEEAQRN